jgi:hypothetical protein
MIDGGAREEMVTEKDEDTGQRSRVVVGWISVELHAASQPSLGLLMVRHLHGGSIRNIAAFGPGPPPFSVASGRYPLSKLA